MQKREITIKINKYTEQVLRAHIDISGNNLNDWIASAIYEKLKNEGIYTNTPIKPWGLSK
jgi:uncharacterized protein (DUF1778 family)